MRKSCSVITGLSIVAALSGCVSAHREKLPEPNAPAEKIQQNSVDMPIPDVISINRIISFVMNEPKIVSKQIPFRTIISNEKLNERS